MLNHGGPQFDASSPWWVFERLQRLIATAPALAGEARAATTALEAQFMAEAIGTEAEAADLIAHGKRERALNVLRALVDSTTSRSLDLAQNLAEELAPRVEQQRNATMSSFWASLNSAVGMPDGTVLEPARDEPLVTSAAS
jgi:hypothetical protein